VDWASAGLATFVALTVYLVTLAPEVALDYSGVYSTAAMYSSPSMPPGHPVWAIYGWCFVRLILVMFTGYGLMLFAAMVARSGSPKS
jgi:hypothetical protein